MINKTTTDMTHTKDITIKRELDINIIVDASEFRRFSKDELIEMIITKTSNLKASRELRQREKAQNSELLKALKEVINASHNSTVSHADKLDRIETVAYKAIKKAEG